MTKSFKPTAAAVKREASALREPARAEFLQRFFRTGPGEYAEGDRMLGLTVPDSRKIAKAYRSLPLSEIAKLLHSPFHEHRLVALLVLVGQHKLGNADEQDHFHRFYLSNLAAVNNWDLVDSSAATLVGEHIPHYPLLLAKLVKSKNLWARRVAMVGTFAELRRGRTAATFHTAELLLADEHDLIHKAVGWLLREAGKRSHDELIAFLRRHYTQLPRTTLRYAIERFDPMDRKLWLNGPL